MSKTMTLSQAIESLATPMNCGIERNIVQKAASEVRAFADTLEGEEMRKEFEDHAHRRNMDCFRFEDGSYSSSDTAWAWKMWQAALAVMRGRVG